MSRTAKEIETTGLPCEAQNGETIQVVPKINVTMFGKFTLKQEGMEVPHAVSLTGRSRRLWTLTAYLILNRNRGVSAQELIDLLWPEAENDNPLSTLQNNVSRARAALAELGFTHAKVIIHNEKGYYRWAPDRETQLDVEQFETLAKAALAEEDMEKSVALAQKAVALYTGDFLTESAAEFWCINLNTYYRSLYTRLCRAAVDRLLKLGRITDAEKLCTGVIRLDPAAEEFSVFLMQALIKNKSPKKALEHYDYIAALYREVYGVSPSAELEAQKALAVQELYGSETSEDDIHTFLLEKEQEPGAFCCDNNVFREIVNLHVREMRRNDTPAALMIVRLANRSIDPEKRAIYMKQMEGTLLNELRAGDPFTKVGANQFWVLLPGATGENGGLVSRRVFNRFQKEYPKSGATYTFKSLDLRHIHMRAEEKATEKTERRKA